MENMTLKDIIDTGGLGIALIALFQIWKRLNQVTDRMFVYLEDARRDRHEMRQQLTEARLAREHQREHDAQNKEAP